MTGRLRYVLAAAFVAFFFVLPQADHEQIAFLKVKAWLTPKKAVAGDKAATPFLSSLLPAAGDETKKRLPPLQVQFRTKSDTIDGKTAAERQREWATRLERSAREWCRVQGYEYDPKAPPMQAEVLVGDNGFQLYFRSAGLPGGMEKQLLREPKPGDGQRDYYPDRWSLLPAFLAIILAILTAKVIPSLLLGCLAGAWLYARGPIGGIEHFARDIVLNSVLLVDFNVEIMAFVFFLFMSVGIMTRSGGIQGMVVLIQKFAKGPISSQLCSYVIGLLIFFDDYSNCVITGSTMKPLTDRNRVSREKLSYIVDATAAPIAGISIFSTWVAYEISMFAPQLPEVTNEDGELYTQSQGFEVFLQTIPYRVYCVFTLVMVLLTILLRREFGPMLGAERRAAVEGKPAADDAKPMVSEGFDKLEPIPGTRCLARNALIPIISLVVITLGLIFYIGHVNADGANLDVSLGERLRKYLGATESQKALFWASLAALLIAAGLTIGQRILTVKETVHSALNSAKALGFAVIILILAWSIGNICRDSVGTSQFLTAAFGNSFSPWLLPSVMFLLSALVAFSTGTSYGTMAILLPNVIVLSHNMGTTDPSLGGPVLMLLTIGAVLEGSIFGDHCSPISDTTVLSSVATGSDHLHHVRTQAPYAVFIVIVSMVCGYLPLALISTQLWWLWWLCGVGVITGTLFVVGRSPDRA